VAETKRNVFFPWERKGGFRGLLGRARTRAALWIGALGLTLGFIGAGRAWGRQTSFDDAGTIVSKGAGFRYVIARRLGLSMGLDVARGPEKTAYYLQVGNAWR